MLDTQDRGVPALVQCGLESRCGWNAFCLGTRQTRDQTSGSYAVNSVRLSSRSVSYFAVLIALIGTLLAPVACAQQEATFSEFISLVADTGKLNDGLIQLAKHQAAELRALTLESRTHEAARDALSFYTAKEMVFIEHSFKLGIHQPLDTYRNECLPSLGEIKLSFGLQPSYSLLEKVLKWLETHSR